MSSDLDFVVIGAGIAGLAAACRLEDDGATVLVVDPGDAPGGVMRTDTVRGHRIERGPSTVRMKPALVGFAQRRSLMDLLERAAPASRERSLLRGGRLVPVPAGPLDLVRTSLLSGVAKRRLLREPFVSRSDAAGESVSAFVARRLGAEVVDSLLGPFLTGVYAGDERQLGAEAVFPALVNYERDHGSILGGAVASFFARRSRRPEDSKGLPGTWGGRGGMGEFSAGIAATLRDAPRLETRALALEPEASGFLVTLLTREGDGERRESQVRTSRVVVATDAACAAQLVVGLSRKLSEGLEAIAYAPIASVALSVATEQCEHPPRGFGFLVPRAEERMLLGCLFMSQLFRGRAPEGRELLHCMLGGVRNPGVVDASDDEVAARAVEVVAPLLGLKEPPVSLRVQRWQRAVAQPGVRHPELVRDLRRRLPAGLQLAGAYLDGVAVADALASGVRAAAELALSRG